jgi:hypothetical protein
MTSLENLSVGQLRKVVAIKEKIERLQTQLNSIAGTNNGHARPASPGRRVMSAAAKARIAAAQRLRWAKVRGRAGASAAPAKKAGRRKVSAATKARLAAIAKARWAKAKASGKSAL